MKVNHKGMILIALLLVSVMGLLFTPSVQAAETYTYTTNPGNPFAFSADVLYTETDDLLDWSGAQTWYHQVYLLTNKIYLFYWGTYSSFLNFTLVKSNTGTQIFDYTPSWDYGGIGLVVLQVAQSGTYNLTIDTAAITTSRGFTGVGFFEVKELVLGQSTTAPETFPANAISFAYYNFGTTKSYKQTCCTFSRYFHYENLTTNYAEVMTPIDDSMFTEDPLQFNQTGTYITYHFGTSFPAINEHTSGIPFMEGYSVLIALIAIGIYLYAKKIRTDSALKQL